MATSGHPISSLPATSARARTTVACLLMGLAVLAGSCATTASAQGVGGGGGGSAGAFIGFNAGAGGEFGAGAGGGGGGGGGCAPGLGDMLPKVEVETVNVTVHNRLDCNLPVVRINATLGSPKVIVVAPPKFGPTPLHVHVVAPASSANLIIQVLPDKEEYVRVSNAASMVVALSGNLSIVVVKFCQSPRDVRGLLLEVTNELKLETQTICVEVAP